MRAVPTAGECELPLGNAPARRSDLSPGEIKNVLQIRLKANIECLKQKQWNWKLRI